MSLAADASSPFRSAQLAQTRTLEIAAAAYGIVIVSVAQWPIMDLTAVGSVLRYLEIVVGLLLFAFNMPTILARFTAGETFILFAFCAVVFVSTLSGVVNGINPEPGMLMRQCVLSVVVYGVAKLLVTEQGFERYLRWYFYLCIFAAVQAIAATGADILRVRSLYEINLVQPSGEGYYLSWGGLLGASTHNFRTNFYFSEASHFAHMLIPAIIYALVRGRLFALLILLLSFLTTVAGAAAAVLLPALLATVVRFRPPAKTLAALVLFIVVTAAVVISYILSNIVVFRLFLIRDGSVDSKLETARYILVQLMDYPFGLGPINLPDYFRDAGLNAANGVFVIAANYGFPGLIVLAAICLYLIVLVFRPGEDRRISALALGVLAIMAATFTHGPTFKYYVIFMLSALNSFRATRTGRAEQTRAGA